jgi:hypothetical protein
MTGIHTDPDFIPQIGKQCRKSFRTGIFHEEPRASVTAVLGYPGSQKITLGLRLVRRIGMNDEMPNHRNKPLDKLLMLREYGIREMGGKGKTVPILHDFSPFLVQQSTNLRIVQEKEEFYPLYLRFIPQKSKIFKIGSWNYPGRYRKLHNVALDLVLLSSFA